ncbi:SDR family NAD(P)-dependent oxidoreductase [Variovorax sp. Sphag1AA]|uniref:SDR family NAD(P)-dependent oxidoreductase n=1 Tax=Variovorax sp. Sphag1AA TaxID=2587027 RepID=UPI00161EB109|nr:SDR family oxidoreductase [Variovorax sp. Sphag1AA]MBB3180254.1 NAD(P)-dependent dehydrogenase (short-subunit alcohol dehydrogenase family) [Variovorax sp. Sphag1AA]
MSFEPTSRLDGKVAVITGGLGAIGYATARRLATLGATCVLLHRKGDDGAARAAALPGGNAQRHSATRADIVDTQSLRKAAAEVQSTYGRCDILVNSAGHTQPVPAADLEALTDELIDDLMRANFRGVFATIRVFAPLLKASGDALVVNVSSIAGFTGVGSNLAYVAAKAGLDVVGDALAKALAPAVRVVSVSPGAVESAFVPGRGDDFKAKMATTTPLGRIGSPEDVAGAIEALATTMRFVTGTRIVVDGGRHL